MADFGPFRGPGWAAHIHQHFVLLLASEFGPVFAAIDEQGGRFAILAQGRRSALQRAQDGCSTGGHQALHQQDEERGRIAPTALSGVPAMTNVLRDGFVKLPLAFPLRIGGDADFRDAGLEEGVSLGINSFPFFRADH